jgi:CheY-like chemotaxis protein
MKVLVIDDNGLHLKMCRILLKNLGHEVETADSMAQLKKIIPEIGHQDVVLIDYRLLPGETGVDVLEYLKKGGMWSGSKYIAVTADVGERSLLERAGFDKVVFKPITEALLKEIVR